MSLKDESLDLQVTNSCICIRPRFSCSHVVFARNGMSVEERISLDSSVVNQTERQRRELMSEDAQ